jgi:hypothetical protein
VDLSLTVCRPIHFAEAVVPSVMKFLRWESNTCDWHMIRLGLTRPPSEEFGHSI